MHERYLLGNASRRRFVGNTNPQLLMPKTIALMAASHIYRPNSIPQVQLPPSHPQGKAQLSPNLDYRVSPRMPPSDFANANIDDIVESLTTDEAILLTAGVGFWKTHEIERLGVPAIKVGSPHSILRSLINPDCRSVMARMVSEETISSWEPPRNAFL